ncbi:MAG: enoyl-CoA hydratase/isomerase family protein [Pseudomonadales bacterium]
MSGIELERDGELFQLTMNAGENRWNTTFVRAFAEALDEVENSEGPAALLTTSASEKFFSNGLDLDWLQQSGDHPGGDRQVFGEEFMALMGRIITLPIPTVCVVNGHGFGAGFMLALCHDVRLMREDRGYLCANEMQLGMVIPPAELALFKHKLPANVFFETVQLARRWTGPDALAAGIVQALAPLPSLQDAALSKARSLAPLAANRAAFGAQKESIYGANAALGGDHGAAHKLKHSREHKR